MKGFVKAPLLLRVVTVALFGVTPIYAETDSLSQRIVVVFRYDDVSAKSSSVVEARLIEAFRQRNIRCTWAVIPFVCAGSFSDSSPQACLPLPAEKAKVLATAAGEGVLDIALHGCTHQTMPGSSVPTEFVGVEYGEQLANIEKGKAFLEQSLGMPISIFSPPWNRYDDNTVRVLEASGFECISAASFGTDADSQRLKYLPGTCDLQQLPRAIQTARRVGDAAPIIVVVFHGYDLVEDNTGRGRLTCAEFEILLDWLVGQEDVDIKSISEVLDTDMDLSPARLAANGPLGSVQELRQCAPPFLPRLLKIPLGVYWSSSTVWKAGRMKTSLHAATAGFYLGVMCLFAGLFFFLERVVSARHASLAKLVAYGALVLSLAATAYALRDAALGYRGATTASALVGVCLGVWPGLLLTTRRRSSVEAIGAPERSRTETRSVERQTVKRRATVWRATGWGKAAARPAASARQHPPSRHAPNRVLPAHK